MIAVQLLMAVGRRGLAQLLTALDSAQLGKPAQVIVSPLSAADYNAPPSHSAEDI